ncbi:hypothetical protein HS088_TW06G00176 [Tripterygium wilfordii]|uniref:F-box domain-containing protein n=1 Tax=Tripterygium wilfordii TaxID=458696 RepID=A0A7J7DI33_TRIWF|nr:hypothetical protein HS088_TW06G00176 [Tripterygium wilfordii]
MDESIAYSSSNWSRRRATERSSVLVNLPDSLLVEILCRLPRKSANRCKSVCKRWLSLMSTPYFESQFMLIREYPPPLALLVQYVTGKRRRKRGHLVVVSENPVFGSSGFSLSFVPYYQGGIDDALYVVRSSRDLLLCAGRKSNQPIYYICNTKDQDWIRFTRPPTGRNHVRVGFLSDSEEECCLSSSINSQRRYKVVRVPQVEGCSTKLNLEIFSSENWKWSLVVVPFPQGFDLSIKPRNRLPTTTNVVAYNGLLLWWSIDRGIVGYDPYNVDNPEKSWLIGKPFDMMMGHLSSFGTCRGRLRICQMAVHLFGTTRLMVWELDDFGTCRWSFEA